MTDQDITELLVHPRFRAAIIRMWHAFQKERPPAPASDFAHLPDDPERKNDSGAGISVHEAARILGFTTVAALHRYTKSGRIRKEGVGRVNAEDVDSLKLERDMPKATPPLPEGWVTYAEGIEHFGYSFSGIHNLVAHKVVEGNRHGFSKASMEKYIAASSRRQPHPRKS